MTRSKAMVGMLILAASSWAVQGAFRYSDVGNTLNLTAKSAVVNQLKGPLYRFVLRDTVKVDSKEEGLTMSASRITLDAVPMKANAKKIEILKAVATGTLLVTKTGEGLTTKLSGSSGDYSKKETEGTVNLKGPVTITNLDATKAQTLHATGSSGTATLATGKKSDLKTAVLAGPVQVTLVQAPLGTDKGGTIVAKGAKMVLNRVSKPGTVTMTGNVTIEGRGPGSFGVIRGVGKAVLTLNEKGQVTSFQTEAG